MTPYNRVLWWFHTKEHQTIWTIEQPTCLDEGYVPKMVLWSRLSRILCIKSCDSRHEKLDYKLFQLWSRYVASLNKISPTFGALVWSHNPHEVKMNKIIRNIPSIDNRGNFITTSWFLEENQIKSKVVNDYILLESKKKLYFSLS